MTFNPQIKHSVDVAAIGVGAVHWLGWWKDNVGTIAATIGLFWIFLQIFFYFKDRFKGK